MSKKDRKDRKLLIEDILECIKKIERYVDGMDFALFKEDEKTIDAVIKNLETIGEAAQHIPDDIKARHKQVPWRGIIGLRNRIVHGYFNIDLEIIWGIVRQELPDLKVQLEHILKAEHDNDIF
jgi:uncharacterized protein with HEPN domain